MRPGDQSSRKGSSRGEETSSREDELGVEGACRPGMPPYVSQRGLRVASESFEACEPAGGEAASCPSRIQVNLVDNRPVFDEVVERRHAVQTTQAALLVTAFFGFVVHDGPIIDPNRAGLDLSRNP